MEEALDFFIRSGKKIWVNFKRMLKYMMNSGLELDECSIINWMKINSWNHHHYYNFASVITWDWCKTSSIHFLHFINDLQYISTKILIFVFHLPLTNCSFTCIYLHEIMFRFQYIRTLLLFQIKLYPIKLTPL